RARKLAPDNLDVLEMAGYLAEQQNNLAEALALFRQASDADPKDVRRLYKVSELLAIQAGPTADAERAKVLERILEVQPNNLPALVEHARRAVAAGDREAAERSLDRLAKLSPNWSGQGAADARVRLAKLHARVKGNLDRALQRDIGMVQNLL